MHSAAGNTGRRSRRTLAWLCALWACNALAPAHAVQNYSESAVKAAFVLRFAGYVEWPQQTDAIAPFVIAVLGDDSLASNLESLAADRSIFGRPVQVRRVAAATEARDAEVLVVGASRRGNLRALLRPLAGSSVLVVSAEEDALAGGSVINFLKEQDRIRFEVSLPAARRMGLRISSELLSVAARVQR